MVSDSLKISLFILTPTPLRGGKNIDEKEIIIFQFEIQIFAPISRLWESIKHISFARLSASLIWQQIGWKASIF